MPYTRAPYTHARGAPHVLDLDGDGVGSGEGPHNGEEVPHQEDGVARHGELPRESGHVGLGELLG